MSAGGPPRADPPRETWDDVADWTPARVVPGADGPLVEWVHTEGLAFDDPFLGQTLGRALRHPFRLLVGARTRLADLPDDAARAPALPVAGVVLHMSRCGSTLVAQSLDALPRLLVVSEPAAVDHVLRLARAEAPLPDGSTVGAGHLRAVVDALARRRRPEQQACVFKLDAWAVADLPLLRAALPGVPWVFLHRYGGAVLASHRRGRGAYVLPGALPGPWPVWRPDLPAGLDLDEHAARTLAALCGVAADRMGPDGLVVDHVELPEAVTTAIAPHFGIDLTDADRTAIAAAAERDAKNPTLPFTPSAPPPIELVALAEQWVEPERRRLMATSAVPAAVRLPWTFPAAALAAEARALDTADWEPHFNTGGYDGDWSTATLRAPADGVGSVPGYPDPTATSFVATALLDRCPTAAAVLAALPGRVRSARFLRLGPGAEVHEHRDHELGHAFGEVRLHVGVTTTDGAGLVVAGEAVAVAPGECWYVDTSRPHAARNPGPGDRIHLVVDVEVDATLDAHLRGRV